MEEDKQGLLYKNSYLFYQVLYRRLFKIINEVIDENKFNINYISNIIIDFTDSYAYYIIGKKPIESKEDNLKEESEEEIKKKIIKFNKFTEELKKYPSKKFIKIRTELKRNDYDMNYMSVESFILLYREYYEFYNVVIDIIKNFIDISSKNGFLPIIKSQKRLRTIGFANYDLFFNELEELKSKLSEITQEIKLNNMLKCRRASYCVLLILSPYFKKKKIFKEIKKELNFKFLEEEDKIKAIKKYYQYDSFINIPSSIKITLNEILNPIKENISYLKRYISYELGEIELSPRIKKKYYYDPTWT